MVSKNQLKLITSLQQKKYRNQYQLFFAEGKKVIDEFYNANYEMVYFITSSPELFYDGTHEHLMVSDTTLNKMSALVTPNQCLAVFKIPSEPSEMTSNGIVLALDNLRDPGNMGTIIRLCDWFGVTQLLCSDTTVDVYNPKVIQATMGSLARVQVSYLNLAKYLEKIEIPVYGAFMEGKNVYTLGAKPNGIIVLGNEANGISEDVKLQITEKISIPRFGKLQATESLNVATAAAILLSEFRRETNEM
jgi:RNA methyltransferase, TrmH family